MMKRSVRITQLFLCFGVIIPPIVVLLVISAALVTPGYSHLSETVSALGTTGRPHPEIISYGLIASGLLVSGFAYGFFRLIRNYRYAGALLTSLLICGIGILLAGIFSADPKETDALTMGGITHVVSIAIAFFFFLAAVVICIKKIFNDLKLNSYIKLSFVLVVVCLPLFILFFIPLCDSIEGLIERIILVIALLWLEVISLRLLSLAHSGEYLSHRAK